MLKNYFKIAIAVLTRRKFFTFISLFGISFTLAILMVLTAFVDKLVNDNYPDRKRDQSLYVNKMGEIFKNGYQSSGSLSFYFLDHYAGSLKTPVAVGISSNYTASNAFVGNKKIVVNVKYTNAAFWDILEYDFREGRAFTKQQIQGGDQVAVISEDAKKEYFGDMSSVAGKYIDVNNTRYKVVGVIRSAPVTMTMFYADVFLPYTADRGNDRNKSYRGNYTAVLLGTSKSAVPAVKAEYEQMIRRVPAEDKGVDRFFSYANSYLNSYLNNGDENNSNATVIVGAVIIVALLFMLLPTLNLVNINISRIMERSSEIGVRKAFGASSMTLVYQFVVENIIITLLGGIIGVLLSLVAIYIINASDVIANLDLSLNLTVLSWSLLICLFFGLLSGVYPAWRMSRLDAVTALKGQ
jgi:putative ABC transport system permease protein